jgi:hypothetical protein
VKYDPSSSNYWLYEWIDDQEIRKISELRKVLRRSTAVDRLIELREGRSGTVIGDDNPIGSAVIAGRRVDLSGFLGCSHFECVSPQIDTLFSKTWHYFDTIIVDDPNLGDPHSDFGGFMWDIEQRVQLLLYLRKIGASENIAFSRKVSGFCQMHFREYAESNGLGLDVLFDDEVANSVVQELLSRGRFEIEKREDGWHYTISHPQLEPILGTCSHSDLAVRPSREEVARDAFGMYCSGLIADVAATRDLQAPLLQVAEGRQLFEQPAPVDDSLVALNLRLPVLTNVSAKEILRLKRDNWPEFDSFRSALRKAIKAQIEKTGSDSPEEVAQAVIEEFVTPELAAIGVKLGASRKALERKIGANVAVSGATVSTGLIAHSPLVFATAILAASFAAIKSSMPEVNKYFDNRGDIETSEVYFLWKARVRDKSH